MEEITMDELIRNSRELRNKFLADPYRPGYHFVVPEGLAMPFDPNGCIYWQGKYHLCYIYQDPKYPHGGHCWGHVSSIDLIHWVHHPPALVPTPDSPEVGIFSGNCFINKKGEATMLYHGVNAGNSIATCSDENLNFWKKLPTNPIIPNPPAGSPYASWDPHGWLENDTYYGLFGGSRPAIFKATELDKWEYVGDLLAHALPGVDINEDISCPDLFKLGNKYVLVCISHRLGCRYYVGEWKNEQFYPEFHEKMSWIDNAFFAPESLEDNKGRRILWTWIFDGLEDETIRARGWSGTMSLPRVLWLGEDNTLRMCPPEELEILRYNPRKIENFTVKSNSELNMKNIHGDSFELNIEITPDGAGQFGVKVFCSPDGEEQTVIFYDSVEKKLKIDTTISGLGDGPKSIEGGPFELKSDELLNLRVFVDKSVVEVFANERQAVMRRVYPTRKDSQGVMLFSQGGDTKVKSIEAWDMAPSNPC
ncbi:MAG: beta-fructofuranosidase [Candidatus Poribacteria bacterium]|nr:beta-fructofuranosidase [Candidatus Poribacteria bacterium]